jgi:hypothetical protein
MLTLLSALVAAACMAASARRLAFAVSPTALDPRLLEEALRGSPVVGWKALGEAVARVADASWERDLLRAFDAGDETSRVALINEQLGELDWRTARWDRVPRVCASVATSSGFLFASVTLMTSLALPAADATAALFSAVDALAVGIAGTAFCAAVHFRARRLVRERLAGADALVTLALSRLESDVAP